MSRVLAIWFSSFDNIRVTSNSKWWIVCDLMDATCVFAYTKLLERMYATVETLLLAAQNPINS